MLSAHYRYFGSYRFILAIMVMLSHFESTLIPIEIPELFGSMGGIAVHAFFVLSGFVIAEALDVFYKGRLLAFIKNRALRIFPPFFTAYLLALITSIVLAYFHLPHIDLGHDYNRVLQFSPLINNLLSIFNFFIPQAREHYYLMVRPVWTLVIEWQFYVSIALFFYFFCRSPFSSRQYRLLMSLALLTHLVSTYPIEKNLHYIFLKTIFHYMPYFLCGMVIYWQAARKSFYQPTEKLNILLACLCFSFVIYSFYTGKGALTTILFIVCIAFIGWLSRLDISANRKRFLQRTDVILGSLSYPLFLNHFTIQLWFYGYTQETSWSLLVSAVLITVAVSGGAHLVTEPLIKNMRDRIRGQKLYAVSK